jgi:transposase
MKREKIEKVYDQGKEAVVALVEGLVDEFTTQIKTLTDRIKKLEAQVKKNSNNSSKPPFSDDLKRKKKTRSQRKRTGKSSGGQKDHGGNNLELTDSTDEIIILTVDKCDCCGKPLVNVEVKDYDKRQKSDIPEIKIYTTEYQAEIKDCDNCGAENKADFPEGVTHKAQYDNHLRAIAVYFRNYELIPVERSAEIFEDIFGISLSQGTVVNATKRCAKLLIGFSDWVLNKLIDSEIVHFDETGVRLKPD